MSRAVTYDTRTVADFGHAEAVVIEKVYPARCICLGVFCKGFAECEIH